MKKPTKRAAGGTSQKVVSIVPGIEQRRIQEALTRAARSHLRQEELAAEWADTKAQLADLDLDAAIAACEAQGTREARVQWAELRALRAMQRCVRGEVEAGLAEWEEVIAAEPAVAQPYLLRHRWLGQTDVGAALADCERAVAAEPRNAVAYARRGDCHQALGDLERAVADYRRAIGLDPDSFDVHFGLGNALRGLGRLDEARLAYTRAIGLAPGYVEPYFGRAACLIPQGELVGALQDLDRVLQLDPSRDDVREARGKLLPELGNLAARQVEALTAEGEEPEHARLFTDLGRIHLGLGRKDDAFAAFDRALHVDPDAAQARAGRGALLWERGEHARSLEDFDRAAALEPDDADHHVGRAKALATLGRMPEAVAAAARAIELDPRHVLAHRLRAVYRSHAEDGDAAFAAVAADLRRAWELMPKAATIRAEYLDYIVDHLGRVDEAIGALDEAIRLEPRNAKLHYERGRHKVRRPEMIYNANVDVADDETAEQARARELSAIVDLEKALALGERTSDAHWELIAAREGLDDRAAYLAEIDRAIAAFPEEGAALVLRESLRSHAGDAAGAAADRERLRALGLPHAGA